MRVASKRMSAELYRAGRFGNAPRIWDSPQALRESGYTGLVMPRSSTRIKARTTRRMSADAALRLNPAGLYFQESAPDQLLIANGEIWDAPGGIYLDYSTKKGLSCRAAMELRPRERTQLCGLRARLQLRGWFDAQSHDLLWDLFTEFPGAVVEFGCYLRPVGPLRTNVFFWEVRHF